MPKTKLKALAKVALESGREHSTIKTLKRIQGGSINEAYFIETDAAKFFMKYHANSPRNFFKSEARGLRLIKETNTISVPNYISYSDQQGNAFLVLEWIEGEKRANTEVILGQKLAQLHRTYGRMHGLEIDTYIGLLPQPNEPKANWLEYYRTFRLKNQMNIGIERGYMKETRAKRMDTLLNRLDEWIPSFVEPSHLHGDLYGGNWIVGPGGKPYLVDPSFLYGDRHFELAFTYVFGGFSQAFYDAYNEAYPIRDDFSDVKPLYQLYYLLAHLNMFGEAYGERVDNILAHYVG